MFGGTKASYAKIGQDEESEHLSPSLSGEPFRRESPRPWRRFAEVFLKVAICILAGYGFYSAVCKIRHPHGMEKAVEHHHQHFHSEDGKTDNKDTHKPILHDDGYVTYPDHRSCTCGATVEESLAMGCKYDSLALAWLPEHCRDDELTEEFEHLGPGPEGRWELFEDEEGTKPLNFSYIQNYPGTKFYMTMEWHDMHCVYTWRKLYRSRWLGITMDRKSDGLNHIAHCMGEFLRRDPLQALTTYATIDLDAENPEKLKGE